MSILITGGAGYIGSHMVHALVESGESVVVLDNLSTGFKWAVPCGVALVIGETGDDAVVSRLIAEREVSAIIHFAASIVVPDSMSDPLGYYRNNTVNSRALIECAVRGGVRQFIFSSTAAVYGNPAKVPVSEDDAVNRSFLHGPGCPKCNQTGYRGRLGIYEWLRLTEPVGELVVSRAPTLLIRRKAIEEGMQTLRESGIRAVLEGSTTVDEVLRYT